MVVVECMIHIRVVNRSPYGHAPDYGCFLGSNYVVLLNYLISHPYVNSFPDSQLVHHV